VAVRLLSMSQLNRTWFNHSILFWLSSSSQPKHH